MLHSTGRMRLALAAIAALSLVPLAACSSEADTSAAGASETADEAGTGTLAAAIAADDKLSTIANALKETGLDEVFSGKASYTLLAPEDDAFASLGDKGKELTSQPAAMAAVLRDHTLPGYFEMADIAAAIDAKGGPVEMPTMGGHKITFSRDGETIVAKGEDGGTARLVDHANRAENGIALPIDGLLKQSD